MSWVIIWGVIFTFGTFSSAPSWAAADWPFWAALAASAAASGWSALSGAGCCLRATAHADSKAERVTMAKALFKAPPHQKDVRFYAVRLPRLHDPRRFGAVLWHSIDAGELEQHVLLRELGVEPLEDGFSGALLHKATRTRSAPIKQVLLAGDIVVGVGNIYACESLFRAGI